MKALSSVRVLLDINALLMLLIGISSHPAIVAGSDPSI
jgi:hypothetical protein